MGVNFNELEFLRARVALENYCRNQNALHQTQSLVAEPSPPDLLLCQFDGQNESASPQLKCCLRDGKWLVYYPGHEGDWNVYPNLPVTEDFQQVIDELERAPLHVHWS